MALRYASLLAMSSANIWEDDQSLSLLQMKTSAQAAPQQRGTTVTNVRLNTTDYTNQVRCQAAGDVHVDSWINGEGGAFRDRKNPQGPGLYPLITRSDGSEAVQFYQFTCPHFGSFQACAFMNSLAFKFGDVIVRIHPDMDNPDKVIVCLNDEPVWSPDKP